MQSKVLLDWWKLQPSSYEILGNKLLCLAVVIIVNVESTISLRKHVSDSEEKNHVIWKSYFKWKRVRSWICIINPLQRLEEELKFRRIFHSYSFSVLRKILVLFHKKEFKGKANSKWERAKFTKIYTQRRRE